MAVDLYSSPRFANHPVGIDEKGAAHHAHVLAAVVLLERPGAIRAGELFLGVRQQRERQLVFCPKALVTRRAVWTDAEDAHIELLKIRQGIAEPAGLGGAARRIV